MRVRYRHRKRDACCPCCGSSTAESLYTVSSVETVAFLKSVMPAMQDYGALQRKIETLWQGSVCEMLRCRECTFTYAHPFVAADGEFYDLIYSQVYCSPAVSLAAARWEFSATLDHMRSVMATKRLGHFRLLEIGAGNGEFVCQVAPALTPLDQVMCTEFADEAVRAIRARGIRCEQGDIRDMDANLSNQPFDVVCMFHVLEHLDSLDAFFHAVGRQTAVGSHFYIAVPSDVQREYFDQHAAVEDMPPMHISRWNPRTLAQVCSRHGWVLRDHRYEPLSFAGRARLLCQRRFAHSRISRWVSAFRQSPAGKIAWWCIAGFYAIGQLPGILRIAFHDVGGVSQWAHFERHVEETK